MKRTKPSLIIGLLLSAIATNATAQTRCDELVLACDRVVAAKNNQIEKLELGLAKQTERVVDLTSQLESKNEQLQAFYRNPFVMLSLGLVAGAAVITFAK